MVENRCSSDWAEGLLCWGVSWLPTVPLPSIHEKETIQMKYVRQLGLLACAAAALMAFAGSASALTCTSRKTGFSEFHEFDDLTGERNTMFDPCTVFSGDIRCIPVSKCYVGGSAIGTVQLTVPSTNVNEVQIGNHNSLSVSRRLALNTGELTVRSATSNEVQLQTHINGSEYSTSTIGTNEGTQLKARLA